MIWSPGRNYLFIHIPKTGGTSLALALEGRAMKEDVMLGDTPKALKRRRRVANLKTSGRLWKHSALSDLEGLVPNEDLETLFVFTLVRNPWDRMVSYYHWLRGQEFDHPAVRLAKTVPFKPFVLDPMTRATWRKSPARSYVCDREGQDRCRSYIRIEHLKEDAQPLWAHLGFTLEVPHVNLSDRDAQYGRYFDQETQAAVAEIAAEDISQFGYTFEGES
ncbi:MAG: sulfotransferase family 2 domain-containing protein [Rhodobacteraceae bacterium]|nr:sulfotransferase family 2 domain-containing protein [Paracoccaceae bacterium]